MLTLAPPHRDGDLCVCPPDVLFDILDILPARSLLAMRGVSRHFMNTVDSLLRGRFLAIIDDPSHEMVFESSSPANYRSTLRQLLSFSRFLDKGALKSDIAAFRLPTVPPVVHFLPLDEDELFGSHLLSVHIRGVEKEDPPTPEEELPSRSSSSTDLRLVPSSSPFPYGGQTRPIGISAIGRRSNVFPSSSPSSSLSPSSSSPATAFSTPSSTPPQRRSPSFSFSLSLAEGLERLYRNWFESPTCKELTLPRESATHVLAPGGGTALVSATIACYQVPPIVPTVGSPSATAYPFSSFGSTMYVPGQNSSFEFHYNQVDLDVAKILVSVEEGLSKGGCRGEVVLWMSL